MVLTGYSLVFARRMLRVVVALSLLALPGCGSDKNPATPGPPAGTPTVVVLGDSLTAGPGLSSSQTYPALLQSRARVAGYSHAFVNAGVIGDTTGDGLRRMDASLGPDTRVLIIALGANDGLGGLPIESVKQNLRQIIERGRARNLKILLCGMEAPPSRGFQYSVDFHFIFPDLASEYQLPLMPFLLEGVVGDPNLNLPDGLHPNAAGMQVIAGTMWPYLEPLLKETS